MSRIFFAGHPSGVFGTRRFLANSSVAKELIVPARLLLGEDLSRPERGAGKEWFKGNLLGPRPGNDGTRRPAKVDAPHPILRGLYLVLADNQELLS